MNPVDDLISSSASVPGVTPDVLGRGRAELEAAIAAARPRESAACRKARSRWTRLGELRGKTVIGVAGVAAAAAAASLMMLPSAGTHPAGRPPAGSSGQAALTALTYSVTPLAEHRTSASVLEQAAKGAEAARHTPQGNPQLVNGWPNARYWHTVTEYTDSLCPGQAQVAETWIGKASSGVITSNTVGSVPAKDRSNSQCQAGKSAETLGSEGPGPFIGGQQYTWAQFAALPTSPAALWPILQADSTVGVASDKGIPEQDWLYDTIMQTLENDPVAPAMRMALLADAEKISGVTVAGKYTDSAGRTGIALRVNWNLGPGGTDTTVVDTGNGQILAEVTIMAGRHGCTTTKEWGGTEISCVSDGGTLFLSADPANTAPSAN